MAAPKGRAWLPAPGEHVVYARVRREVVDVLEAGARALNISRSRYVDWLVSTMPRDERGLPPWLAEIAATEQLPLDMDTGKEPDPAAA
jgi:hypothetical protein